MDTPLPPYNTDNPETHCCDLIEPTRWDNQEIVLDRQLFAKVRVRNFLHVPLSMGTAMKAAWAKIKAAQAEPASWLMLSVDESAWRGVHYLAVSKEVPGLETTRLPGTYRTKVFEGPYRDAPKWVAAMQALVKDEGHEMRRLFFFYTACPKCAQHFGKNYVVGFAQVA